MEISTINTNNIIDNIQLNLIKISTAQKIEDNSNNEIYDSLDTDISSSKQDIMNFNDAIGYMQIADNALNNISKEMDNINELKVASNNAILNTDNKNTISSQMQAIEENITKTINETSYNGRNVFSGNYQIGDMNINLNLPKLDISNPESIDNFSKSVKTLQNDISSFVNSSTSNIDNLTNKVLNEEISKNNNETDITKNINDLNKNQLLLNAALLAQAHNTDILKQNLQNLLG